MKKLIKLTCLSLFITLFVTSCSEDDSPSESFSDTIKYSGEVVDITSAFIEDYGADSTYYNYDFTLEGSSGDIDYEFYIELFSKGTDEFRVGTFEYVSETPSESSNFYFEYGNLYFGDTYLEVIGGSVTVSGSGDNYSISGVLTLENEETLTVSYDGTFIID